MAAQHPLFEAAAMSDPAVPVMGVVLSLLTVVVMGGSAILMGILGQGRRIGPNSLFGLRTTYTMSDDRAWYEVHEAVAPWSIMAGVFVLPALGLVPLAPTEPLFLTALLGPMAVSIAVLLTGSMRAHRTARARLIDLEERHGSGSSS